MADLIPIEVMISSAVSEKVGETALSEIRDRIAERLRATQVAQANLVRVWLSEQQGALSQDASTWDTCVAEARRCDIFIGLYTGNAGWVRDHLGIGICHAEWQEAFQATPAKTRIVLIDGPALAKVKAEPVGSPSADRRFYDDLAERWRAKATTPDEVVEQAYEAVWLAVIDLLRAGKGAGSRGRNLLGASLEWANLDFERRERAMLDAVNAALVGDDGAGRVMSASRPSAGSAGTPVAAVVRELGGAQVAFVTHAVPGPFAVPEARSSLGQPFREEVLVLDDLDRAKAVGPIQVIAVQQNVTESQVRRFIGRPDALVAAQSFGIFASDDAAFTQALFLSNCRDPSRIASGVSAAFEWWQLSGLERSLAKRATARTAVLHALRDLSQA